MRRSIKIFRKIRNPIVYEQRNIGQQEIDYGGIFYRGEFLSWEKIDDVTGGRRWIFEKIKDERGDEK